MSLRLLVLACMLFGCGGGPEPLKPGEPQTARAKLRLEAKKSGELDERKPTTGKGWRYQGDRDNCFFLVGARCFKSEASACHAARCGSGKKCRTSGAGPVNVSCK
ncbi:MAG: hypothetical protein AB7L28_27770 [Kofleriaceae bacterium]